MHEWALAEAVVSASLAEARRQNLTKITEVTVRLGELQRIDREVMETAIEGLIPKEGSPISGVKLAFETEPAEFRCRACGHGWKPSLALLSDDEKEAIHFIPEMAHVYVGCPKCQSPDFEVVQGRGMWLAQIKGVQ